MVFPPPSGLSKKPHSLVPETPTMLHRIPSDSITNFRSKALVILLVLAAIPLFPLGPPYLISTSGVLSEILEILHLLLIGIAVTYGIFSTRITQMGTDERAAHPVRDGSDADFSGISNLSSIFEHGFENGVLCEEYKCIVQPKIRSFVSNDSGESNCGRMWRSHWSKGESFVVVSNARCFLGDSSGFEPLNLPVRNLRSDVVVDDDEKPNSSNHFEVICTGKDDVEVMKIQGMTPKNLDRNFEEASRTLSMPWRSRSERMGGHGEQEEEEWSFPKPLRFRPHSVGAFEFEHLDSDLSTESPKLESESSLEYNTVERRGKSVRTIKPRKPRMDDGTLGRISSCKFETKQGEPEQLDGNTLLSSAVGKNGDEKSWKNNKGRSVIESDAEVDRKAGEFIAKFRQQIRLQKTATSQGYGRGS